MKCKPAKEELITVCVIRNEYNLGCNGCKYKPYCEDFKRLYRVKPFEYIEKREKMEDKNND